ncbi:lysophospholipase L1-like esterase [Stackebrandtia albiflava]|uniref:Lysophospholipase L1-like esterase n=1 Tax=Stackebrandtia albiflava TaxID=406432 RepID=A0A562UQN4_9ACTN|nr:SGNH/GDSL hydrolase family protein [Stackebrandtia albiflava]TWJ07933.1 lysophospholipase L1-like esterase [Stackebrandtia albiflava]
MRTIAKRALLWTVLAVMATAAAVVMRNPVESPLPISVHDGTVSIMPLGDSISGSTGCWRSLLWNRLADAGYDDLDFVGKRQGPECDEGFDDDSRAYSGFEATGVAEEGLLFSWLKRDPADVMLVHIGSNDIRRGDTTDEILAGYSTLVDHMRQMNPHMVIVIAQIIPMTEYPMDKACLHCPSQVDELNARIPAWAEGHDTVESPILVVDQNAGFDVEADTYDGLHTDGSGARKMADKWYSALRQVLAPPSRAAT